MNLCIIRSAALLAQAIIIGSLLLPVLLQAIFYLKKKLQKETPVTEELFDEKDYAVVVYGIRSQQKAEAAIRSLLKLNYTNYLVYVVMNENSIHPFFANDKKIILLQPKASFADELGLHQYTIGNLQRSHTHIVFLDEHSIADPDYLNGLNACFHEGFQAVQSMSIIKSKRSLCNTIYNMHNAYNRFFRCHLPFAFGSSATLNHNGMAFSIPFYKRLLQRTKPMAAGIVSQWQNIIVEGGHQIAFAPTAIVCNEQPLRFQQLKQLHAHSISHWHKHFWSNGKLLCNGIVRVDKNCFLSGMMLLQLPLFTTVLLAVFCLLIAVWINPVAALIWMISLVLFSFGFLLAMHEGNQPISSLSQNPSILSSVKNLYEEREAELYSAV